MIIDRSAQRCLITPALVDQALAFARPTIDLIRRDLTFAGEERDNGILVVDADGFKTRYVAKFGEGSWTVRINDGVYDIEGIAIEKLELAIRTELPSKIAVSLCPGQLRRGNFLWGGAVVDTDNRFGVSFSGFLDQTDEGISSIVREAIRMCLQMKVRRMQEGKICRL